MKIKISKNKLVYNYCEPYIIAEIGANHNGDMDLAKEMILSAKRCGADCAKFQSWSADSIISNEEYDRNQSYNDGDGGKKHFGSLKEMVTKYQLTNKQHKELKEFCDDHEIDFCSTPFSVEEADLLNSLDIPFFKIASMDINNESLLRHVARFKKPVIISTGMSTLDEIDWAVKTIENEGNFEIIILHCISIYPPKFEDINLNNISMLQRTFNYPIGFSDHSIGSAIPLASVALGTCLIEKHFTLDKDMPGWDHKISADSIELIEICKESKAIQKSMGVFQRVVSEDEEGKKLKFRRSIVASRDLKKGDTISKQDITSKRPGTGISPNKEEFVVGRVLNKNLTYDTLIKLSDLV
jgi:sialic acid synthase SpsE